MNDPPDDTHVLSVTIKVTILWMVHLMTRIYYQWQSRWQYYEWSTWWHACIISDNQGDNTMNGPPDDTHVLSVIIMVTILWMVHLMTRIYYQWQSWWQYYEWSTWWHASNTSDNHGNNNMNGPPDDTHIYHHGWSWWWQYHEWYWLVHLMTDISSITDKEDYAKTDTIALLLKLEHKMLQCCLLVA